MSWERDYRRSVVAWLWESRRQLSPFRRRTFLMWLRRWRRIIAGE